VLEPHTTEIVVQNCVKWHKIFLIFMSSALSIK